MKLLSLSSLLGVFLPGFLAFEARAVDFQEEIRPILNSKCFKCHTGPRAKGKLRMDSVEQFSKRIGGEDPVIVPGESAASLLIKKVSLPRSDGDAMPPPPARARGAEAMTTIEIELVKKWIDQGASFESGGVSNSGGTKPDGEEDMKPEMLKWTNFEGNSLTAAFVRADGKNVILKMEDGSEIPYPFDKLSPESQEVAKKLASQ